MKVEIDDVIKLLENCEADLTYLSGEEINGTLIESIQSLKQIQDREQSVWLAEATDVEPEQPKFTNVSDSLETAKSAIIQMVNNNCYCDYSENDVTWKSKDKDRVIGHSTDHLWSFCITERRLISND